MDNKEKENALKDMTDKKEELEIINGENNKAYP